MNAGTRPSGALFTSRHLVLGLACGLVIVATAVAVYVAPAAGVLFALAAVVAPAVLLRVELALNALVAVIVLLPFGAIPLGLGFNPSFLDLALFAAYALVAVRLAQREIAPKLRLPLGRWVVLFVGLLVAALLAGIAQGLPAKNQLRTFAELVLAAGVFFVVDLLSPDHRTVRRLFWTWIGLGVIAAAVGLVLYVLPDPLQIRLLSLLRFVGYPSGPQVLRFINDDPTRLQRATGTAIDPNSFGGMLAVITALLLPQLVARRPAIPRPLAATMAAALVMALLATVSRGSLVGLLAAAVVIGVLGQRQLLVACGVAALVGLTIARFTPWTASYVEHFAAGLALADRATQMRLGEYRDALTLITRYPLLGVGFGTVRDVDLYRGVSSLYLSIAESMGLVGLAAFLTLLGATVWRVLDAWRRCTDEELAAMLLGCLAALAALLASGLFDHYFFTYPHAFALLWLLVALAMTLTQMTNGHEHESQPRDTERSRACP